MFNISIIINIFCTLSFLVIYQDLSAKNPFKDKSLGNSTLELAMKLDDPSGELYKNYLVSMDKVSKDCVENGSCGDLVVLSKKKLIGFNAAVEIYQRMVESTTVIDEDVVVKILDSSFMNESKPHRFFDNLEHFARNFPFNQVACWAFEKLLFYSQINEGENKYFFSSDLLRALALNSSINNGLNEALVALSEKQLRIEPNSSPRGLVLFEKLYLYMRLRRHDLVQNLLSSNEIQKQENRLGYIQAIEKLSRPFSEDFEIDSYYRDNIYFVQHLNMIESLRVKRAYSYERSNKYFIAALQYRLLRPLKGGVEYTWLSFWNYYRAGFYEKALEVELGRPKNVAKKISQIEQRWLYYKGQALNKIGKKNESDSVFRMLVKGGIIDFYSFMAANRLNNKLLNQGEDISKSHRVENFVLTENSSVNLVSSNRTSNDDICVADPSKMNNSKLDQNLREYLLNVIGISNKIGLDDALVFAIMKAESGFNPNAVSPVGASGIMQVMPYTGAKLALELGDEYFKSSKLHDPIYNISYGSQYVKKLLEYYNYKFVLAIAAYNAGPIAVNRWLSSCIGCEDDVFVDSIPYNETRLYVKKVLTNFARHRFLCKKNSQVDFSSLSKVNVLSWTPY